MASFDLTTNDGFESAKKFVNASAAIIAAGTLLGPVGALTVFAGKKLFNMLSSEEATEAQTKMAQTLIKEGKENGVDNMEIIVDNKVGLSLDGQVIEGCPIKATLGSNNKMTLKVQYKA